MKRKFGKCMWIVAVAALAVGIHTSKKQSSLEMSSLLLENVEALAQQEDLHVRCFGVGTVDCPGNPIKVYMYESWIR